MKLYHFPIVLFYLFITSSVIAQNYAEQLSELEKQKAAAVSSADYLLAGEINEKIKELKANRSNIEAAAPDTRSIQSQIKELEARKTKAVEQANYKVAGELKAKIAALEESAAKSKNISKQANDDAVNAEIRRLEVKKDEAVAKADFKQAAEIKAKITELQKDPSEFLNRLNADAGPTSEIARLEKQKADAIANKDYKLAGEINFKIIALQNKNESPATPSAVVSNNGRSRISRSAENEMAGINYRRSSLYSIIRMSNGVEQVQFADVIQEAFMNAPIPTKFNNHNLEVRAIPHDAQLTDEVAKHLVAAWFNRDEQGKFNMELVKERGLYNASSYDINVAQGSVRGLRILEDAGEELLGNTFVIINEFNYVSKEKVANKAKKGLGALKFAAGFIPGVGGTITSVASTVGSVAATVAGKGYWVKNTSHLYQLVWNEEIANEFYTKYWVDDENYDPNKVVAFDNCNLFKLKYVGFESAGADLQSSVFTDKSDAQLIAKATTKAIDKGIAKLERKFEQFRTKTPLFSVDPATAKIGTKEGLEPGDKYEVLEQIQEPDGKIRYVRKGILTVDKHQIWDNTFSAEELVELGKEAGNQFTVFKGPSGQFAPGMLIRQIN